MADSEFGLAARFWQMSLGKQPWATSGGACWYLRWVDVYHRARLSWNPAGGPFFRSLVCPSPLCSVYAGSASPLTSCLGFLWPPLSLSLKALFTDSWNLSQRWDLKSHLTIPAIVASLDRYLQKACNTPGCQGWSDAQGITHQWVRDKGQHPLGHTCHRMDYKHGVRSPGAADCKPCGLDVISSTTVLSFVTR